jgi:hypothetical protein
MALLRFLFMGSLSLFVTGLVWLMALFHRGGGRK